MQHLKFTYVDSITGISIASEPATNGPVFPDIEGLQYEWARESQYPTDVPEFFGTCPDASGVQIDGVLAALNEQDYETMRADEMRARSPVPVKVTRRQARQALALAGLLDAVQLAIDAIPNPIERQMAQIEWDDSLEFERQRPLVIGIGAALGLTAEGIDNLFVQAAAL